MRHHITGRHDLQAAGFPRLVYECQVIVKGQGSQRYVSLSLRNTLSRNSGCLYYSSLISLGLSCEMEIVFNYGVMRSQLLCEQER